MTRKSPKSEFETLHVVPHRTRLWCARCRRCKSFNPTLSDLVFSFCIHLDVLCVLKLDSHKARPPAMTLTPHLYSPSTGHNATREST